MVDILLAGELCTNNTTEQVYIGTYVGPREIVLNSFTTITGGDSEAGTLRNKQPIAIRQADACATQTDGLWGEQCLDDAGVVWVCTASGGCNAANWGRVGPATTATPTVSPTPTVTATPVYAPYVGLGANPRRYGFVAAGGAATSTVLTGGFGFATLSGETGQTASAQPSLAGATQYFIQYAALNISGSGAGVHSTAFDQTRIPYRPRLVEVLRTDTAITTRRVWVGLAESSMLALAHTTGTAASAIDYVAMGFDTSISDNWLCCSGDGTNHGCTSTGVAVAGSTVYTLVIDWSVAGTLTCTVSGTPTTKTSNLSTGDIALGIVSHLTTLDDTARNFQLATIAMDWN
jgi:hypothetical protein